MARLANTARGRVLFALAVLVAMAVAALADTRVRSVVPTPELPAAAVPMARWWVVVIAAPFCLLTLAAAVRTWRPRQEPVVGRGWTRASWLGLAGFLVLVGTATLVIAFFSTTRSQQDTADTWVIALAALFLVAYAIVAGPRLRRAPRAKHPPRPRPPRPDRLTNAARRALAVLDTEGLDPREAVIRCYRTMEDALAGSANSPHAADTPSEVLGRVTATGDVRAAGAWRLVELFDEARFSRHHMSEHDRAEAAEALRLILADLS